MRWSALAALIGIASCSNGPTSPADPASIYFERLSALCTGSAYSGRLVSTDDADRDFQGANMVMGPAQCDGLTVRIPFAVAEDRSRTWILTRTVNGVRLKHDHRHKDGSEDTLTQYGGDSLPPGTEMNQAFPADDETKALFIREGIEVSTQNTWSVEILPGEKFAYQMQRPERLFRVEFDLSTPVETPPLPWGEAPIE